VQVTVGEEGFFGPGSPNDAANPQVSRHLAAKMVILERSHIDEPVSSITGAHLCAVGERGYMAAADRPGLQHQLRDAGHRLFRDPHVGR